MGRLGGVTGEAARPSRDGARRHAVLLTADLEVAARLAVLDLGARQVLDVVGRPVGLPLTMDPNLPVAMLAANRILAGKERYGTGDPPQLDDAADEVLERFLNFARVHETGCHGGIIHRPASRRVMTVGFGVRSIMPSETAVVAVVARLKHLLSFAPFKPEAVPELLQNEAKNIVKTVRKNDRPLTDDEAQLFYQWLDERRTKQSTPEPLLPVIQKVMELVRE